MKKRKLELVWDGKDEPLQVEPRILLYDKEKSYGEDNTENILIHGDNLLALKALYPFISSIWHPLKQINKSTKSPHIISFINNL